MSYRQKTIIFFFIFFITFFAIDFFTKSFLYDHEWWKEHQSGGFKGAHQYKNAFFGIRSLAHYNSTLFSFLGLTISIKIRLYLHLGVIIMLLILAITTKSYALNICFGIILGGVLGNTLDIGLTRGHFVRDIIFLPWVDRGTFNLADIFIILGATSLLIITIIKIIKSKK